MTIQQRTESQTIKAPGFYQSQSGVSIGSRIRTNVYPTSERSIVNKEYVDSISGSASSLQEAYEGGSTIDIDPIVSGNLIFRDAGSNSVFMVSDIELVCTKPLEMSVNKITSVGTPTDSDGLSNMEYVMSKIITGTLQGLYESGSIIDINTATNGNLTFNNILASPLLVISETLIDIPSSVIVMNSNRINNLALPAISTDMVSKQYVDANYPVVNVGSGGGSVYSGVTGTGPVQRDFRTITGVNGMVAAVASNVIQLSWGGIGKQIIDASIFAGATADVKINAALATADAGAIILVDRGFGPTEELALPLNIPLKENLTIIFGSISFNVTNSTSGGTIPSTAETIFSIPAQMSWLTIKGAGCGSQTSDNSSNLIPQTVFTWDAAAGNAYIANFEDGHYLTFEGMKFIGKDQGVGASGGIRTTKNTTNGTQGFRLKNIHIGEMTRPLINLEAPLYCHIEDCILESGGGNAIQITNAGTTNLFSNLYIENMFDAGFRIQGTAYSSIINCEMRKCGIGILLRSTFTTGIYGCKIIEMEDRDATYPGYGIKLDAVAEGTGIYNCYCANMIDNIDQRFLDFTDSKDTNVVNPVFDVSSGITPTNAIVNSINAIDTSIIVSSDYVKLPENVANTDMLLNNSATGLTLIYDGYYIQYGSVQRGPVFHDTAGTLKYLEANGSGVVSGTTWTPTT